MKCQNCGTEFDGAVCPKCMRPQQPTVEPEDNKISLIIRLIGWLVIVIGSIIFLVAYFANPETHIFLVYIISSVIVGLLMVGFSEVIKLLQSNFSQLQKLNDQNAAMLEWMKRHEDNGASVNVDNAQR